MKTNVQLSLQQRTDETKFALCLIIMIMIISIFFCFVVATQKREYERTKKRERVRERTEKRENAKEEYKM